MDDKANNIEETMIEEKKDMNSGQKENFLIIPLKKPITFEGERYDKIDLTGLEEIKAADMVAINRRLSRNGNTDMTQEMTLEYALNMASLASGIPLEFFEQLPPYAAMMVKGRVTNFIYRQD